MVRITEDDAPNLRRLGCRGLGLDIFHRDGTGRLIHFDIDPVKGTVSVSHVLLEVAGTKREVMEYIQSFKDEHG